MLIAIFSSVTVSIADDIIGRLRLYLPNLDDRSTWLGEKSVKPGSIKTSSNVAISSFE